MIDETEFLPIPNTLLKYENPVIIEEKKKDEDTKKTSKSFEEDNDETQDILNIILPVKEWEDEGHLWRQEVSKVPATRNDVVNLQEKLDMYLQQKQARETGLCAIRRELYSQCFDEIIRQVTLNCIERGVLLARIRDEIKMTMHSYQTLYCSSIAYGIRKSLLAEQQIENNSNENQSLKKELDELKVQVDDLNMQLEQTERRFLDIQQNEEKKHSEEIQFLRKSNQQLKTQLEGIIAPKK